jgi:SagB-type dehydrogenase family enzyme
MSRYFGFAPKQIDPNTRYALCRFSYARREGRKLILESPLAHGRVLLGDSLGTAVLHALAQPRRPAELSGLAPDLSTGALALLLGAGMVRSVVDDVPALHGWEFHELVFHASSRMGRHDRPVGAVYPFATNLPPPPALEPAHAEAWLELDRPDLNRIEREDAPFVRVLETRRTVRDYGARPINIGQLRDFLYRTARVRLHHEMEVQTPRGMVLMDFAPRTYPNGGSLYELELYTAVNFCSGLTSGLYYYDPLRHALGLVSLMTNAVDQLLAHAAQSAGIPRADLQVLLVIAARFSRRSWKYASTAYSNILKNAGVLYETMYLVATAMGLAPSSLPDNSGDLFAAATGSDYYSQMSVGGFLLGRIRDGTPADKSSVVGLS